MINLSRQEAILETTKASTTDIVIIGAGSVGSFTTLALTKMGISSIQVFDFDKVEVENISNQLYRVKDIGLPKVECLKQIILEMTGTEIETFDYEIKEDTDFLSSVSLNTIFILAVDNIETRKLVYNKIKDYPIKMIDTRMGGLGWEIYAVDLQDMKERIEYEKSLEGKFKDIPCGLKAISFSIMSLASETANLVKKIINKEDYERLVLREMNSYSYISRKRDSGEE